MQQAFARTHPLLPHAAPPLPHPNMLIHLPSQVHTACEAVPVVDGNAAEPGPVAGVGSDARAGHGQDRRHLHSGKENKEY